MSEAVARAEISLLTAAELIARIDVWLLSDVSDDFVAEFLKDVPEGTIDMEKMLFSRLWADLTPGVETHLDRLRKKVEVVRKLYRYYRSDLSLPVAPLIGLSGEGVQRLCGLLLKAALVRRDARYLNSALKLLDGVLGRHACPFPDEMRVLAQAVLEELVPMELQVL